VTKDLRRRFARSVGAYSVITFLFGVGDRHLDNLMVRADGTFFHIDYGFCLGQEPNHFSKIMPIIPLNNDLVEPMGFEAPRFREAVKQVFLILRRHVDLFSAMFSLFSDVEPHLLPFGAVNRQQISVFVRERFRPSIKSA